MKTYQTRLALLVMGAGFILGNRETLGLSFRDIDNPGSQADGYLNSITHPSYEGRFDLVTGDSEGPFTIGSPYPIFARGTFAEVAGFNPDTMQAISGKITFWVKDDATDDPEQFSIYLDELSTSIGNGTFTKWRFDTAGLSADLLIQINETGDLTYRIVATQGDFILDYAMLEVEAISLSVPDSGTTASLLGFGLLGLAGARRRFLK